MSTYYAGRQARNYNARLRAFTSGIGSRLDRNRREFGHRPKPLRRKHRLRKVEAEELVGTVLIRHRQAAPRQQRRAEHSDENIFQDHGRPSGMLGKESKADLGSRQLNSKGRCRKISTHHLCTSISPDQLRAAAIVPAARSAGKDLPFRTDIPYITY